MTRSLVITCHAGADELRGGSFLPARIAASLGAIAVVTLAYAQFIPGNPTTVALSYVVVILSIATRWGIAEATAASLAAVLCFNFFFLPPVGTFTIADPQNWVALVAFLLTAIVASQVSGRRVQRIVNLARDMQVTVVADRSIRHEAA